MLVIHKSGCIEINCSHCKRGVYVPLALTNGAFELRKAEPRFVMGLTRSTPSPQE